MKKIPLRVLPDPKLPDVADAEIRSADVFRNVIRQPLDKQRGAEIDAIRKGIRILDALDAAANVLELEDADYDHLKQKILAMQWGMIDKRLLQVVDDVLLATDALTLNDELHAADWAAQAESARDLVNRAS